MKRREICKVKLTKLSNGQVHVSGLNFKVSKDNCDDIRSCLDKSRQDDVYHVLAGFCFDPKDVALRDGIETEASIFIIGSAYNSITDELDPAKFVVQFCIMEEGCRRELYVSAEGRFCLNQNQPDTSVILKRLPVPEKLIYNSQIPGCYSLIGAYCNIETKNLREKR